MSGGGWDEQESAIESTKAAVGCAEESGGREGMSDNRRKAIEEAERRGLKVVEADDLTLQLDLDRPFATKSPVSQQELDVADIFREHFADEEDGVVKRLYTASQNGNEHRYLRLRKPLSVEARIALQAILGSDPKREILSLLRVVRGVAPAIVLFEMPEVEATVKEFLEKASLPARD